MSPPDPVGTVARAWVTKAEGDLAAARVCARAQDVPAWVVGFHLQQAVEKTLKGFLVLAEREPPATHDLVRLDDLLREAAGLRPVALPDLEALVPFAVEDRYPGLFAAPVAREDVEPLLAPVEAAVHALADAIAALPSTTSACSE